MGLVSCLVPSFPMACHTGAWPSLVHRLISSFHVWDEEPSLETTATSFLDISEELGEKIYSLPGLHKKLWNAMKG